MAAQGGNKSRNQLTNGGYGNARWLDKKKGKNKKLRKQQKASRRGNR